MTAKEIQESFKNADVVSTENKDDEYIIKVRFFETGTQEIKIGDKTLLFEVQSRLDSEKTPEEQYEQDIIPEKPENIKKPFPVSILLYIVIIMAVIFGVGFIYIISLKYMRFRKEKNLSPFERYTKRCKDIGNIESAYVNMSFAFKEYIYYAVNKRIYGKTSSEIMSEINNLNICFDEEILAKLDKWFRYADMCKYTSYASNEEEINQKLEELTDIVMMIEKITNNQASKDDNTLTDKG